MICQLLSLVSFLANIRDTLELINLVLEMVGYSKDPINPICSLRSATCVSKDEEQNRTHQTWMHISCPYIFFIGVIIDEETVIVHKLFINFILVICQKKNKIISTLPGKGRSFNLYYYFLHIIIV